MLRTAGLLGLVLSAGLLGILQAEKLTRRIRLLEDFQKMVLDLKGQMNYFRIPLVEIFRQTAEKGATEAFQLLEASGADLREKHGEMGQIWAQNADSVYKGTPLTDRDRKVVAELGSFIGQTDFENQKVKFCWLEDLLQQQLEEARHVSRQKGPMYRRIGFFGGILAALVLL